MKAPRMHLGLLYVAFLILIVATIPFAQRAGRQPRAIGNEQPATLAVRPNPMKL
ncbi:MAG: hypothetical protein AAAC47_09605 [Pararhizobium sp.]